MRSKRVGMFLTVIFVMYDVYGHVWAIPTYIYRVSVSVIMICAHLLASKVQWSLIVVIKTFSGTSLLFN